MKNNYRKIHLLKIGFLILTIFVLTALTACGGNNRNHRGGSNYRDSYSSLVAELNRLSINNIDDIEDMVYIAWDYGAAVEVEFFDHYNYYIETDYINNDRTLENFLDGLYYNEFIMLDAEVLEEGRDLFLIFSVELY